MSKEFLCNACHCNKSHKLSFCTPSFVSKQRLEIVFSDVWTYPVISHDSFKYYVIFVDHFAKYIWFYPLKIKSKVKEVFVHFNAIVENYFKYKIITLYSDNGGEYLSLKDYFAINEISYLTTHPHTPEHNGYSERRHRHIVEKGLALLSHASIPLIFWSHAFLIVVYLINRMHNTTLNLYSLYELIFKNTPNYSKLKVFGCLCYPWLQPYSFHKLDPRSKPCVFRGYSLSQSAYLCFEPSPPKFLFLIMLNLSSQFFLTLLFKLNYHVLIPSPLIHGSLWFSWSHFLFQHSRHLQLHLKEAHKNCHRLMILLHLSYLNPCSNHHYL